MEKISLPFLDYLGARLLEHEDGRAVVGLEVKDVHLQHLGFVHGGVISTLSDNTGWYAVMSCLPEGHTSVTIEIKINYLKPATGTHLKCVGEVIRKGRTQAFVKVEVLSDDKLVAYATGTYAILEDRAG